MFGYWPSRGEGHGREVVSSVESVFKFGEVSRDILAVDRPVGADDRSLDVAERGVYPFESGYARGGGTPAGLDGLAGASGVGHAGVASQGIADDLAGSIKIALDEPRQGIAGKRRDPAQLDADRLAIHRCLNRGDERGLPSRPRPRLPPERSPPR